MVFQSEPESLHREVFAEIEKVTSPEASNMMLPIYLFEPVPNASLELQALIVFVVGVLGLQDNLDLVKWSIYKLREDSRS